MAAPLKILMVVAECTPFAKTGGLADVAGSLPKALKALGHDVRVILPFYSRKIDTQKYPVKAIPGALDVPLGHGDGAFQQTGHLLEGVLPGSDVPVYFVKNESYFDREDLYRAEEGDYEDNPVRFSFFSRSALVACKHLDFQPDVIHCNDWHTALVPVYLRTHYAHDLFFKKTSAVFTIHNLAYQGLYSRGAGDVTGLPDSAFSVEGMEFYGQINMMKGGIVFSDLVNTVSQRYAQEIQTPEGGFGLDGVLKRRSGELWGILNGIDTSEWSPEIDRFIPMKYGPDSLDKKQEVKNSVLAELGLHPEPGNALLGMISRLDNQKGFDLLSEIIDYLMNDNIQMVILGTGDRRYHDLLDRIKGNYPDKVSVHHEYTFETAHKIAAASDIFLMPSKFEPCGLNQLISLRYGTIPVVRNTGGLADTVQDFDPKTGEGTGFVFHEYASMAFLNAIKKSLEVFENKSVWTKLMKNAMAKDYSWDASARKYEEYYLKAMEKRA